MLSCSPWNSNGKASTSNHNSTDGESAVAPFTALLSCFPWSSKGKASASNYNATDGESAVAPLTAMLSPWNSNGKASASNYNATDGESAVAPLTAMLSPWSSKGKASARNYNATDGERAVVPLTALLSCFFSWNSTGKASARYYNATDGERAVVPLTAMLSCPPWNSTGEISSSSYKPTDGFSSPITQGSSPTMPGPASVRRKYEELHPRDRNVKQNRRRRIEKNWGCELQDAIPMRIRPRVELKKGAKIRIGDISGNEEIWWNWSVEVLRSLEELSTMMAGRLTVARELMILEVQKRQEDGKNPQRKVAEILLGDLQRVVDNVKRQQAAEYAKVGAKQQLDIDMESFQQLPVEDSHGTKKEEQGQGQGQSQGQDHGRSPELDEDGPFPNIPSATPDSAHMGKRASQHNKLPNISRFKLSGDPADQPLVRGQLNINDLNASLGLLDVSEMRIRAKRLRTVAMRLEAEAFEMEADLAMARQALNEERDF
ncbi:hypothetical protein D6D12_05922 [Aureobasidium pullulans]|uniref:Uncharacterized protein n=1 Tax=Aureobasidium pullulans TaxID=5580 RepID=A0AB74JQV8_AURPU|nr:hypothetical protein D6D12_05922 [Aureobasidium pullulans]